MIFVEFSWVQKRYCLWQGALFLGCKSPCHKHQGKPNKYHLTCDPLGDATGDGRPNPCDNSDGMYAKQVSILLSYFIMGCDRYHTRGGGVSACTTEYQFVLRSVSRGSLVRTCGLAFVSLRSSDPPSPLSSSITITPLPPIHPSPPLV